MIQAHKVIGNLILRLTFLEVTEMLVAAVLHVGAVQGRNANIVRTAHPISGAIVRVTTWGIASRATATVIAMAAIRCLLGRETF